jgi:hypothetical protein
VLFRFELLLMEALEFSLASIKSILAHYLARSALERLLQYVLLLIDVYQTIRHLAQALTSCLIASCKVTAPAR